jgi:amidohydrolase
LDLIKRFEQASKQIADAHGCEVTLLVEQVAPPVVNDRSMAEFAGGVARHLFPDLDVDPTFRVMVSEDMALFLQEVPGVFIFVGSANEELGLSSSHHTPTFDFDERAMTHAVALLCSIIWEKLKVDE